MAKRSRNIICFDAGFRHLGAVVAELPVQMSDDPKIVDNLVISTREIPGKILKREGIPKTVEKCRRVEGQIDQMVALHEKHDPIGYFAEMPIGSGKGSTAVFCMGIAAGYLAAFLRMINPDLPKLYFSPDTIKEVVTGKRNAAKDSVAACVRQRWPLVDWVSHDTTGRSVRTSYDVEDAGGALWAAIETDIYKALVAR